MSQSMKRKFIDLSSSSDSDSDPGTTSITHAKRIKNLDAPQQVPTELDASTMANQAQLTSTSQPYPASGCPTPYSQESLNGVPRNPFNWPILTKYDDSSLTVWALHRIDQIEPSAVLIDLMTARKRWMLAIRSEVWEKAMGNERNDEYGSNPYYNLLQLDSDFQVEAIFGATIGVVLHGSDRCSSCVEGNGPFPYCIIVPSHLENACVNCHYVSEEDGINQRFCECRARNMMVDFIVTIPASSGLPTYNSPKRSDLPPFMTALTEELYSDDGAKPSEETETPRLLEHDTLKQIIREQDISLLSDVLSVQGSKGIVGIPPSQEPEDLLEFLQVQGSTYLQKILSARGPSPVLEVLLGEGHDMLHQVLLAHGSGTLLDVLISRGLAQLLGVLKAHGSGALLDILLSQGTNDFLGVLLARGVDPLKQIFKELNPVMRAAMLDSLPPSIISQPILTNKPRSQDSQDVMDREKQRYEISKKFRRMLQLEVQAFQADFQTEMEQLAKQFETIDRLAKEVAERGPVTDIGMLLDQTKHERKQYRKAAQDQKNALSWLRGQFEHTELEQLPDTRDI
ncbi:hypothetical protein F5Y04DRAFT_115024 [Hypomontagnella monticulosa]|nr:hypothetical protein F5Y04DRAFT_115024 [Hypomontagnella monticulosa]